MPSSGTRWPRHDALPLDKAHATAFCPPLEAPHRDELPGFVRARGALRAAGDNSTRRRRDATMRAFSRVPHRCMVGASVLAKRNLSTARPFKVLGLQQIAVRVCDCRRASLISSVSDRGTG